MRNPILGTIGDGAAFMKLFSVKDIQAFIRKNWGIGGFSDSFEIVLRFCPSYAEYVQHQQSKFQLLESLLPSDTILRRFEDSDQDFSIPEMAAMSKMHSEDGKSKII